MEMAATNTGAKPPPEIDVKNIHKHNRVFILLWNTECDYNVIYQGFSKSKAAKTQPSMDRHKQASQTM